MMAEKIEVHGIAVRPGVSKNGIMYTEEELNNFAPSLSNKPILKDHEGTTDNTVGLVLESGSDGLGVVNYSGWIKEDGTNLLEKIKDGRIKEVSIGAFARRLVKENDDDEHYTAIGIEAMELSTTPVPAVTGTSLKQSLKSINEHSKNEKIKVIPVFENTNQFNKIKEEINMEEENEAETPKEEPKETPVEEPKEVPEEKEEAKAPVEDKEADAKEESDEAKTDEKIQQSAKIDLDIDTSKLDESIKKFERLAELRQEAKVADKKPIVAKTKGKIVSEEAKIEDKKSDYVVENAEYGQGAAFWKHPSADGSLR